MITALNIFGVIVFLIGVITGILTGSFFGFLLSALGGIVSGLMLFALARMLDNQEIILMQLRHQELLVESFDIEENKACSNCGDTFLKEMRSCPNCGRQQKAHINQ